MEMVSSTWISVKSVKMNIIHENIRLVLYLSQGEQMGYLACKCSHESNQEQNELLILYNVTSAHHSRLGNRIM